MTTPELIKFIKTQICDETNECVLLLQRAVLPGYLLMFCLIRKVFTRPFRNTCNKLLTTSRPGCVKNKRVRITRNTREVEIVNVSETPCQKICHLFKFAFQSQLHDLQYFDVTQVERQV